MKIPAKSIAGWPRVLLFLAIGPPLSAQFSFGVKAGVPITENFETNVVDLRTRYLTTTKRYTLGPTVELRLPRSFALEFDALYRRLDYEFRNFVFPFDFDASTGNSWEFPLLLKRRFGASAVRPFAGIGGSFHHVNAETKQRLLLPPGSSPGPIGPTINAAELVHRFNAGLVLGAGIEFHILSLRISPELRFTRWDSRNFTGPRGELKSQKNQADLLFGVTF